MFPASGGFKAAPRATKIIRFALHGCTNRPFYHIVVMTKKSPRQGHVIEQVGSYDLMPNVHGEKLVALNTERITHWIGEGAQITDGVAQLLGMSGLLPIHPSFYMRAWRNRRKASAEEQAQEGS
ncbi:probable 28S ribosomal protein S16, mitochondrial [Eriocheir sinensis]|uniref:probable 28S ribosomal protein S16, mitochondrial n=1 Tax=Eriocheir sinensis TaxID=95602 RepID=UPI0021C8F0F8|nr:probable 28S ribosomal protein S16, mitochondrial [Eriocheir sinensis]